MAKEIDNNMDCIDSRDIIERLDELENEDLEDLDDWEKKELKSLHSFNSTCRDYFSEGTWACGVTLIRESYFEDYAEEFAKDIGAIDNDGKWPATCIDWEKAANELKVDYSSIDFDGVEYWGRE